MVDQAAIDAGVQELKDAEPEAGAGVSIADAAAFANKLAAAPHDVQTAYIVKYLMIEHAKITSTYTGVALVLMYRSFPPYLMPGMDLAPPYAGLGEAFTRKYIETQSDHDGETLVETYRVLKKGMMSRILELVTVANESFTAVSEIDRAVFTRLARRCFIAVHPKEAYLVQSRRVNYMLKGDVDAAEMLAEAHDAAAGKMLELIERALRMARDDDDDE